MEATDQNLTKAVQIAQMVLKNHGAAELTEVTNGDSHSDWLGIHQLPTGGFRTTYLRPFVNRAQNIAFYQLSVDADSREAAEEHWLTLYTSGGCLIPAGAFTATLQKSGVKFNTY